MAVSNIKVSSPKTGSKNDVNVNYTVTTQSSTEVVAATRSILSMSKPAMMGVGLLALGTIAVGLFTAFRVPGLQEQIVALTNQVDRLETQIVVLKGENDRYETLNADLNHTLSDLLVINGDLNQTAGQLQQQVDGLNSTVNNLTSVRDDLQFEKDRLVQVGQGFQVTKDQLNDQLGKLQALNKTWTDTISNLTSSNQKLGAQVSSLQGTNIRLANVTDSLNSSLADLDKQNQRARELVSNLTVVSQYFSATGVSLTDNFNQVLTALQNNILLSRANTFASLNAHYSNLISSWRCNEGTLWYDKQFFQYPNTSIASTPNGLQLLADVLKEVNTRMLTELCLNNDNFNAFLQKFTGKAITQVSYSDVKAAVQAYGDLAKGFYGLPIPGSAPYKVITEQQWESSSFDCQLLPSKYIWVSS